MHTHGRIDDPYTLLGIAPGASGEQIRRAYRRLAMDWHPDRNTSTAAEETFKKIRLAYELLRDPVRRAEYDRSLRQAGRARKSARGRAQTPGPQAPAHGPKSGRGSDLRRVLRIPLERQPGGLRARLPINRQTPCGVCGGTGKVGPAPRSCPDCLGSGRVRRPVFGFLFASAEPCRTCNGRGWTVPPCGSCGGTGRGRKSGHLSFDVPPGVRPGAVLRIRGHGRPGRAGQHPGDLLVRIEFAPHSFFRTEFPDLLCEVPVGLIQALAGTTLEFPTLDGVATTALPPGSDASTAIRIPGYGLLDNATGRRGDLVLNLRTVPPPGLTETHRASLEEIRRLVAANPSPHKAVSDWLRRTQKRRQSATKRS